MNENGFENELNYELSPEESAAIDRLLSSTAEAEDMEVDYDGMLRAIKARARAEGISVFSAKKARAASKKPAEKGSRVLRGFFIGAGAVAAVFVLGLTGVLAMKLLGTKTAAPAAPDINANVDSSDSKHAYASADAERTYLPEESSEQTSAPTEAALITNSPAETAAPVVTELVPATFTAEPIYTPEVTADPFATSIPTSYPVRGGFIDYSCLAEFSEDPTLPEQLLPEFPTDMFISVDPDTLYVYALGSDPDSDNVFYYSCCPAVSPDEDIEIGCARVFTGDTGELRYVWRVTESTFLDIDLEGYDRETAEQLLLTLPLCLEQKMMEAYAGR